MTATKIYDLNSCRLSDRNGSYGGNAGLKEGLLINGDYWMIKYPKSTTGMRGSLESYTTSPLSEYIGSHIYNILGYEVHDTILGIRNEKLVVACRDFCDAESSLREIRTLKNTYNKELERQIETSLTSSDSESAIELKSLLIHLNYNPALKDIPGIKQRFWDCVVVDGLINNSDRNNGNWGLLFNNGEYSLAPVFDNGASFYNKASEQRIENILSDPQKLESSCLNAATAFSSDGARIYFRDILKLENQDLKESLLRVAPVIKEKLMEISDLVDNIPEKADNVLVCSSARKIYYKIGLEKRYEKLIEPRYMEIADLR